MTQSILTFVRNIWQKTWSFVKSHKKASIATGIVLILILIAVVSSGGGEVMKTKPVEVGAVVQEVSVSGRVVSAQALELGFERSGTVTFVATNGQRVGRGALVAQLNAGDAANALRTAQLNLENAKIALEHLRLDYQTDIPRLQDTITTATNNLDEAYQNGFNAVSDTFLDLPSVLTGIHSVLYDTTVGNPGQSNYGAYQDLMDEYHKITLIAMINRAVTNYQESKKAYDASLEIYKTASRHSSPDQIVALIDDTLETAKIMAQSVRDEQNILDAVVLSLEQYRHNQPIPLAITGYQAAVSTYIGQLNGHITTLNTLHNTITDNRQNLASAERSLAAAQRGNPLDIANQENIVRQREAAVQDAAIALGKYSIRAPFAATVANIDVKVGQFISTQAPIVSLVGDAKFQIETNISEADIAKIKVGNEATVTLDAYGKDQKFSAQVVHIDPAGRLTNAVAVYKVTLEFRDTDSRLLSGLTADVDIQTNRRDNVVFVPSRDIITKENRKFVRVLVPVTTSRNLANVTVVSTTKTDMVIEVPVETGLRGSDGRTEITSGLEIDDQVIGR